jgi:hypothetical protein
MEDAMAKTLNINPDAIYDDGAISLVLDLPSATLAQARKKGQLRYTRKGKRIFYLGKWVLDWLTGDPIRQEAQPRPQ